MANWFRAGLCSPRGSVTSSSLWGLDTGGLGLVPTDLDAQPEPYHHCIDVYGVGSAHDRVCGAKNLCSNCTMAFCRIFSNRASDNSCPAVLVEQSNGAGGTYENIESLARPVSGSRSVRPRCSICVQRKKGVIREDHACFSVVKSH